MAVRGQVLPHGDGTAISPWESTGSTSMEYCQPGSPGSCVVVDQRRLRPGSGGVRPATISAILLSQSSSARLSKRATVTLRTVCRAASPSTAIAPVRIARARITSRSEKARRMWSAGPLRRDPSRLAAICQIVPTDNPDAIRRLELHVRWQL